MNAASAEDQSGVNDILATWVAQLMRPFKLVKDQGFTDYVKLVSSVQGEVYVPSAYTIQKLVVSLSSEIRSSLQFRIASECCFFSASSDIWTARSNSTFISLTIHYVTEDFFMQNWVLEVEELPGSIQELQLQLIYVVVFVPGV